MGDMLQHKTEESNNMAERVGFNPASLRNSQC